VERRAAWLGLVLLMFSGIAGACGSTPGRASAGRPATTDPARAGTPGTSPPTSSAARSTTITSTTSDAAANTNPPLQPGGLPQTEALPPASSLDFLTRMDALWQGIVGDQPSAATPAFFPEGAYLQIKALANAPSDYQYRLQAHFALDLAAAHDLLGSDPAGAQLVTVLVPEYRGRWIPPGACYNRVGYWFVPGSRVVYRQDGVERSLGIAALDSWRGEWYVIHLGSETPPTGVGVVDGPATGLGSYGSNAGC